MSVTQFVISFIFMAVATMTILVVGTLGAAECSIVATGATKQSVQTTTASRTSRETQKLVGTHSQRRPPSETLT